MIVICDKCKGYGYVEFDIGTHKSEYKTKVCSKCKDSGRLAQTTITTEVSFMPNPDKSNRIF